MSVLKEQIAEITGQLAQVEAGRTALKKSLATLEVENVGLEDAAVAIDAIFLQNDYSRAPEADFTQRLVANMTAALKPDTPFGILEVDNPARVIEAGVPGNPFLLPSMTRFPCGAEDKTGLRAQIVYWERERLSTVIASSHQMQFTTAPAPYLRKIFGNPSFSTDPEAVPDGYAAMVRTPKKDKRIGVAVEQGQFDRSAEAALHGAAGEEAADERVAVLHNTMLVLGRTGLKAEAFRGMLDNMGGRDRERVLSNAVSYLASQELDFRASG